MILVLDKGQTVSTEAMPWLLVAVGVFFILGGVWNVLTGRAYQSIRNRWGLNRSITIHRDEMPVLFWIYTFINFLVGTAIVCYGVSRLAEPYLE